MMSHFFFLSQGFLYDYTRYHQQINGFDHHLGQILNLAFDESNGLESAFKVRDLKSIIKLKGMKQRAILSI